ncbi:MAG TPA: TetR/AcrR family transcriptional regulator [Gordonia polyisoprenivorans]|uniref:TetR/AcrR family transcriptional regulator n=1 Tax=Gordonia polyisoprenivorans TaxID=84595 RepID=A0A846WFQ7_9ACTN|nr:MULTISPECIES: TetR/AcrR family transcriptional regulator [Gordonia]MDF3280555.1 TetR/AcrR family transcriptional regulator [Gordonia sp. N1V]NKY00625.1 TetR/AcrR family transcriptional regulator [Gordonia polyisoprenivorans]OPX13116.1 TetR family transcriptional regulator [Gordonia sp. i37]OZC33634.1 TetR/AcrR family transcriptional regulator [Gordonia polyisoprenivorans]UZF57053.1 TetR/AcrR family transcriptional regulator [Gordonia polyisoprenivorans]
MGTLYASGKFPVRGEGSVVVAQSVQKLTSSAIVEAAIVVADRDGLDALSMRRIADELGVGAMSLYRHIADKDALLHAMAEEIGTRFPYPVQDCSPTWRERIEIAVDVDWALYQRHPWVVLAYATPRYAFGTESLAGLDWLIAGFVDVGVGHVRAAEMALAFWSFVNGVALAAVGEQLLSEQLRRPGAEASPSPAGGLADLIAGRLAVDPTTLPQLAALAGNPDATRLSDPRAVLDAGLRVLCAGFAAEVSGG